MQRASAHAAMLRRLHDPRFRSASSSFDISAVDPSRQRESQSLFSEADMQAAIQLSLDTSSLKKEVKELQQVHEHVTKKSSLPAPIFRGNEELRRKYAVLDVCGDGNCGAYVLSLIQYAADGQKLDAAHVRQKLVQIAREYQSEEVNQEYKENVLCPERYLYHYELFAFCNHIDVDCIMLNCTKPKRCEEYEAHALCKGHRPCVIIVRRQDHFRLIVRQYAKRYSIFVDAKDFKNRDEWHPYVETKYNEIGNWFGFPQAWQEEGSHA